MKNETYKLGGELTDYPNDYYRKFFDKFKEISSLKIEEYKPVHIIAYFCQKYKNHYNVDYKFKFNNSSPSKCFEIFQIKKLSMNLSARPNLLIDYIDWVFANKVKKASRRLTSISFLTDDETVNFYKINYLLSPKLDRTTNLPDNYKYVLSSNGYNISTYGDLSFLSQISPVPDKLQTCLIDLQDLGLDINILSKII